MNRYGTQAMRHWQQTDPARYQQIPDPETFFTELGERVESEIQALATAIAGPDRPGETYMEKVGRLNMARLDAESDILREMVLIPDPDDPEIDERPETGLAAESRSGDPAADGRGELPAGRGGRDPGDPGGLIAPPARGERCGRRPGRERGSRRTWRRYGC